MPLAAQGLSIPLFYVALSLSKAVQYGLIGLAGSLVDQAYIYSFWLALSFPVMAYFMLGVKPCW